MDSLLIQFRDNGTGHDDMHVWIEGCSRTTDSYYFAIDPTVVAGGAAANRVWRILIRLLQRWMKALEEATPMKPAYLPFDFSDQYTGCFQCRPDGDSIEIVPGISSREGYTVCPSDPGDYFFGITDFRPDAPASLRLSRAELLRRIRESIEEAESHL